MLYVAHLLVLADAYQAATRVGDKTLGFRVFGDSKKLAALREGADITTQRFNAAFRWFSANWPADVAWPAGVERPAVPSPDSLPGGEKAREGAAA